MKLNDLVKARIIDFKKQNPQLGSRGIGKVFGIHHKTVCRVLRKAGLLPSLVAAKSWQGESETNEVKGDIWTVSLPKTRIHTLEQLLDYCKVDLSVWEVERFICNKWEVGAKGDNGLEVEPLFQVKAFLRRKKNIEDAKKELEALKKLYVGEMPVPTSVVKFKKTGLMLEVNLPDVHFGKLAWGVETGYGNFDVKITEQVYWDAIEAIIARTAHHEFEKILFVVGNDLFNSDDIEGRTTSGTYVSTDARYHKTFVAVRNIVIRAIERLRQVAPVHAVIVSGNHDQLSCWHLGDSLEMRFINYHDVVIDNLPRQRKYVQFGKVMIMLTHGHKGKRNDYPLLMATEQPKMFGETKFRECHTGHIHVTKVDEQHGVRVRILPALTEVDDWLATNGFVGNLRNAEGYVWSAEEGLIEQVYWTVPDERE